MLTKYIVISYSFVRPRGDEVRKVGRKEASFNLLLRKVPFFHYSFIVEGCINIINIFMVKEVNMTAVFVYLSLLECSRADCTIPLLTAKNKLMVPWPDEESRIIAPLKPFQFEVSMSPPD